MSEIRPLESARALAAEVHPGVAVIAPKRIQLRRTAGWRKPEGAVVVARSTRWGNPNVIRGRHVIDQHGNETYCAPGEQRGVAARMFREDLTSGRLAITIEDVEGELAGKVLACWCPESEPCHADVLLEIANREPA